MALEASPWWLVVLVVLVVGAWRLRVLDAAGSVTAALFGLIILLSTGPGWLLLLIGFTAAGALVTRLGYRRKERLAVNEPDHGRRGWRNVVANGVTATAVAAAAFWVDPARLALPFAAAVAVAAADTFASELGSLAGRPVLITRPGRTVPRGTNGGVTWTGTFASAFGAIAVAAAAHLLLPLATHLVSVVVVAGVMGSALDSLLGATWEATPGVRDGPLDKSDVNFISITIPTLVLLVPSLLGRF